MKNHTILKTKEDLKTQQKNMDEIERLKEEIKNNDDELSNAQTKISKLLAYLNYEKEDILQERYLKGKKTRKVGNIRNKN